MNSTPSFIWLIDPNHLCRDVTSWPQPRCSVCLTNAMTPSHCPDPLTHFATFPWAECTCTEDRSQPKPEWDLDKSKQVILPSNCCHCNNKCRYVRFKNWPVLWRSSVHRQLSRTTGARNSCWRKRAIACALVAEILITRLRNINLLTPNVNYSGRTATLTSKVAFYIFIQQI